jgi:hypothetical protein
MKIFNSAEASVKTAKLIPDSLKLSSKSREGAYQNNTDWIRTA